MGLLEREFEKQLKFNCDLQVKLVKRNVIKTVILVNRIIPIGFELCCGMNGQMAPYSGSIAASIFVGILVEFDKYCH